MAVNNERSMNNDLLLGAMDGTARSLWPNRGGQVETEWPIERAIHFGRTRWSDEEIQRARTGADLIWMDQPLRDRISIVTGPTARTRPVAHTQFEANPFDTPLDAVHTSWPDRY
jgi:hypothetical protein